MTHCVLLIHFEKDFLCAFSSVVRVWQWRQNLVWLYLEFLESLIFLEYAAVHIFLTVMFNHSCVFLNQVPVEVSQLVTVLFPIFEETVFSLLWFRLLYRLDCCFTPFKLSFEFNCFEITWSIFRLSNWPGCCFSCPRDNTSAQHSKVHLHNIFEYVLNEDDSFHIFLSPATKDAVRASALLRPFPAVAVPVSPFVCLNF